MKTTGLILLGTICLMPGTARGGPILLGSIANAWESTDPATLDQVEMGDRLLYVVVGQPDFGDLFEDTQVLVRRDEAPVVVHESRSMGTDPDFGLITELLTDGKSLGHPSGPGLQEISVLGLLGVTESIIDVHVPRLSPYDLFGYDVLRVDRQVAFSITSPSGTPGSEGTVFRIDGVYQFLGQAVPEPSTLALMCAGLVLLVARCRTQRGFEDNDVVTWRRL